MYTSYDYGAAIAENRELTREKYFEIKLEAQFVKVTPGYLTALVGDAKNGTYTDNANIWTTPIWGNGSIANFYIIRHTDYQQVTPSTYRLTVNTSRGMLTVPQLGGELTLGRRDSKWHVTDYDMGGTTLLYSTAEILTWKKFDIKTVLVVYGDTGELHEMAVIANSTASFIETSSIKTKHQNGTTILNWQTTPAKQIVRIENLFIYILDRNSAYRHWVPDFTQNDRTP